MPNLIRQKFLFKAVQAQEGDDANFIIRGVFSTDDIDRHDEKVVQTGWKLQEFLANPVVLFAHDNYLPAVGKAIDLVVDTNGQLAGGIQFAYNENELAKTLYNLYKGGFMRAFSVGFRNDVYEVDQENSIIILKENTLFEISCVNVPANSMALAESKGIDVKGLVDLENKKIEDAKNEEIKLAEETAKIVVGMVDEHLKVLSTDNRKENKKVETPLATGGKLDCRKVNLAIRRLLEAKKSIKK